MRLPSYFIIFILVSLSQPIKANNNLDYLVVTGLSTQEKQIYHKEVINFFLNHSSQKDVQIVEAYLRQEGVIGAKESVRHLSRKPISIDANKEFRKAVNCLSMPLENEFLDFNLCKVTYLFKNRIELLYVLIERVKGQLKDQRLILNNLELKEDELYKLIYGKGVAVNFLHKLPEFYQTKLQIIAAKRCVSRLKEAESLLDNFKSEYLAVYQEQISYAMHTHSHEFSCSHIPFSVIQLLYIERFLSQLLGEVSEQLRNLWLSLAVAGQNEVALLMGDCLDELLEVYYEPAMFSLSKSKQIRTDELMVSAFVCLNQAYSGIIDSRYSVHLLERLIVEAKDEGNTPSKVSLLLALISATILSNDSHMADRYQKMCLEALKLCQSEALDGQDFFVQSLIEIRQYEKKLAAMHVPKCEPVPPDEWKQIKAAYLQEHKLVFAAVEQALEKLIK